MYKCLSKPILRLELVEMEVRELLESFGFDSEKTPVIPGSALYALENTNEELGKKSIFKLMDTIDSYVHSNLKL